MRRMFNNILCPLDFTTFSHQALECAVAIARSCGAAVTAIHVVADAGAPFSIADPARLGWTTDDVARMQAHLLKALQEVEAPSPRAVVAVGDPATEIVKLAAAEPTDLIVMPSYGWTGRAEGTCGSVTTQVLSHAHAPVMVVPDAVGDRPANLGGGFRRIACGINFSPASLKALRSAGALASAAHAQLVVTHVLPIGTASLTAATDRGSPDREPVTSMWTRRLRSSVHSEVPADVTVEARLRTGEPAGEILRLADEEHCDLIVIGGHRGNPAGCVMNTIVIRSRCPVLVVRVSSAHATTRTGN